MNKVLFSHLSDEWQTPKWIIDVLKNEYGYNFTLVPCSTNYNHLFEKFFTIEDDGLIKTWENEIVFCNPPYSNIKEWSEKCKYEYLVHNTHILLLVPARTDKIWFHKNVLPYSTIHYIRGRLHFNESKGSAPFPSIICEYLPEDKMFLRLLHDKEIFWNL